MFPGEPCLPRVLLVHADLGQSVAGLRSMLVGGKGRPPVAEPASSGEAESRGRTLPIGSLSPDSWKTTARQQNNPRPGV